MQKVSIACIAVNKGKVFIARRSGSGQMAGRWEFPGGKVEPGETEEQAVVREMQEELGVKVRCGSFICSGTFTHNDDNFTLKAYEMFFCDEQDFLKFNLTEHSEVAWVFPEEIKKLSFVDSDMSIYSLVCEYIKGGAN